MEKLQFTPSSLRRAREAAGLSIKALARRAGVSQDTVQRIESGRVGGRLSTWLALQRALEAADEEAGRSTMGRIRGALRKWGL